jgi:hypothetical protein
MSLSSVLLPRIRSFSILLFLFLSGTALGEVAYWIQTPDNWDNRSNQLGHDLLKQVVAPGGVAAIEVYGASGDNPGLQTIADKMEQGMRGRGAAYLQSRVNDRRRPTQDGADAIFREYTGNHNGIPLRAYAVYTYGSGSALAAFGFYAVNQGAGYQEAVRSSIESLRLSPPSASPTSLLPLGMNSTPATAPAPSSGGDCNSFFGTPGRHRIDYVRNADKLPSRFDFVVDSVSRDGNDVRFIARWATWRVDGRSFGSDFYARAVDSRGNVIEMRGDCAGQEAHGNMRYTYHPATGIMYDYDFRIHDATSPTPTTAGPALGTPTTGPLAKHPKCGPIVGTWKSTTGKRVIDVTADGHLNHTPDHKWDCHPDGKHYRFYWNVGKPRASVWDDIRMDASGQQITFWQAGVAWERFVKGH